MRATRLVSDSCTWLGARRPRLRLVDFLVRMCDLKACPALNLPVAVLRNRLAAARLVLIFGMLPLRLVFVTGPGGDPRSHFPSMPLPACVATTHFPVVAWAARHPRRTGCPTTSSWG